MAVMSSGTSKRWMTWDYAASPPMNGFVDRDTVFSDVTQPREVHI